MTDDSPRHTVYLKPAAERALKKVADPIARHRIARALDGLAAIARPPQTVRTQGSDRLLRIRAGDYRIIYTVDDATRTVLIATIGHRREIYRR